MTARPQLRAARLARLARRARRAALALLVLAAASDAVAAQTPLLRLNCGGGLVVATDGSLYRPDMPYGAPSPYGHVGGAPVTPLVGLDGSYLGGHLDPAAEAHATARVGFTAYRIDLPTGDYLLRLHFAEIERHGPGLRRFDLRVEGVPVLEQLDVAALQGVQYASAYTLRVHVADGTLDLEAAGEDPALLNALELWTAPPVVPPPGAVSGLVAEGGFLRNLVAWDGGASLAAPPTLAGYLVERAPDAAGPWAPLAQTWSRPARLVDEGLPAGGTWWYRVRGVDVTGASGPPSAAVAATVLDPDVHAALPVYRLSVAPEDLLALDADPYSDDEVPAVFTAGGASWDVQVRYRGSSSRSMSKKSWKIKFPADDTFEGQTDLNLKAHFADASLLREPLSLQLAAEAGHAAPVRRAVHLLVNGVDRGVFNRIEQVELQYLLARDRDPGASVYKCDANFAPLPDLASYQLYYEKQTNESLPHDDLVGFIEFLDTEPDATFPAALAARFDVDDYLGYLAMIAFVADEDSVRHNAYLLHDHALGRFELVTWDNDASWGGHDSGQNELLAVDFGTPTSGPPPYNVLKSRVLAADAFRWRYIAKLQALLDGAADPGALALRIASEHAALLPDAPADVAKLGWESDAPFDGSPAQLLQFAGARAAFLRAALPAYAPPAPPTALWINEFVADNVAGAVDEAGEHEDWIELYNASDAPVDASGMFLTDDPADPTRWALPAGTVVPAHGHLLVWADDEPDDGPLHAGFRLGKSGEAVALFAADGATLLDVRHFRPQLPDVSEGRADDGGAFFRPLPTPTPGAPNTTAGNLPPLVTWVEHAPAFVLADDEVLITAQVVDADGLASVTAWVDVGGGHVALPMVPLGADRYGATVAAQPAGTAVAYHVEAVDGLGAVGLDPDDAPAEEHGWLVGEPAPVGLRISEIMADNDGVIADEVGEFDDWIELRNVTGATVALDGLFLTDTLANPTKWAFPPGLRVPAGGHVLVWADNAPEQGPLHASFALGASGESVALFLADGATLADGFAFGPQQTDVAYGRMPDDADVLVTLLDPSPGASNLPTPGAHARYDAGNAAAHGVVLDAAGPAASGAPVTYLVSGGTPLAQGLLVIGVQTTFAQAGAKGTLLVAPLVLLPFSTDGAGGASLPLSVPASPPLGGVTVHLQPFVAGSGLGRALASTIAP